MTANIELGIHIAGSRHRMPNHIHSAAAISPNHLS